MTKVLVIGHGRHGKDTVCDILSKYGLNFKSSSEFCADRIMFPKLKDVYAYQTVEECFNDRHNHRSEWYDLICDFVKNDQAKLGREIFAEHDIYCGLRNRTEFDAIKQEKLFDICVWVDASKRLPVEDSSSMTLDDSVADVIIDNNGTIEHLITQVQALNNIIHIYAKNQSI